MPDFNFTYRGLSYEVRMQSKTISWNITDTSTDLCFFKIEDEKLYLYRPETSSYSLVADEGQESYQYYLAEQIILDRE